MQAELVDIGSGTVLRLIPQTPPDMNKLLTLQQMNADGFFWKFEQHIIDGQPCDVRKDGCLTMGLKDIEELELE